jgi:LPXTG-motif cell wall-anchored protein
MKPKSLWTSLVAGLAGCLLLAGAAAAQGQATVNVASNAKLGKILVDSSGMTLYMFTKDKGGQSVCYGPCAKLWPPLTAAGTPTLASGVAGKLGLTTRKDGSKQVTYNGMPLYTYAGDKAAGDTNGQGFKNIWYVIHPAAPAAAATTANPSAAAPAKAGGAKAGASLPKTGASPVTTALGAALLAGGAGLLLRRRSRSSH